MTITTPEITVDIAAPPIVPRAYGLFSVAPPAPGPVTNWEFGVRWPSLACVEVGVWEDGCLTGNPVVPKAVTDLCKYTGGYGTIIYIRGRASGPGALDRDGDVSTAFQAAEQRGAEALLWQHLSANVDLNTGPRDSLEDVLAVVEGNLATHYNGRGVIHMSPFAATMLAQFLAPRGSQQFTLACGTPVVVGAGYGDPDSPTTEIIGSGAVVVFRGALGLQDAWDTQINDRQVIAERPYVVGWDCYAVKAEIPAAP